MAADIESRKRNKLLVRELEGKKQKLMEEARRESEVIDQEILRLTKQLAKPYEVCIFDSTIVKFQIVIIFCV